MPWKHQRAFFYSGLNIFFSHAPCIFYILLFYFRSIFKIHYRNFFHTNKFLLKNMIYKSTLLNNIILFSFQLLSTLCQLRCKCQIRGAYLFNNQKILCLREISYQLSPQFILKRILVPVTRIKRNFLKCGCYSVSVRYNATIFVNIYYFCVSCIQIILFLKKILFLISFY